MENVQRILLGLLLDRVECAVDDSFRDGFLALVHEAVHELGENQIAKFRVGDDLSLFSAAATGHGRVPISLSCWTPALGSASAGVISLKAKSLRPFCSVYRAALLSVLHALRIEHAAKNVVAHARKVLHAATADQHDRMLLQIVAFARDVAHDLVAVGQPHLRDLAQSRVWL